MYGSVCLFVAVTTTSIIILIEIVLGGYILIGYLLQFSLGYLFLADFSNLLSVLVYVLIVSINLFSIGVLFLALLSGYYEKWFSYEIFGLVSLSVIIYMWAHKHRTGHDLFDEVVVREIYVEHIRSYDPMKNCGFRSDCFEVANFHRNKKCCGWERPEDLFESKWNVDNNNTIFLPKYCCSFWYAKYTLNNCTITSVNRFTKGCRSSITSEYQTFNPISYRYGIVYPILKAISLITFKICKISSLLPRAEGIFSNVIPKWTTMHYLFKKLFKLSLIFSINTFVLNEKIVSFEWIESTVNQILIKKLTRINFGCFQPILSLFSTIFWNSS